MTVLGALIGAAILTAVFVMIELNAVHPMLDLTLFKYRRFLGVQMLPVATCYSYVVLLVLLPLRFIGIEGKARPPRICGCWRFRHRCWWRPRSPQR